MQLVILDPASRHVNAGIADRVAGRVVGASNRRVEQSQVSAQKSSVWGGTWYSLLAKWGGTQ